MRRRLTLQVSTPITLGDLDDFVRRAFMAGADRDARVEAGNQPITATWTTEAEAEPPS